MIIVSPRGHWPRACLHFLLLSIILLRASSALAAEAPADSNGPLVLEAFQAVLWAQTSAERTALFRQVYQGATAMLDTALADPDWVALPDQPVVAGKPPAVILDVDETVLDNAPFHGSMLAVGRSFDPDIFVDWVSAAKADALPGALAFVKAATARGVTVFYVTNRSAELEPATRANLLARGFPLETAVDTLLMRDERPDWTWDKRSRRQLIASGYRIVLLIGDDFNDFRSNAAADDSRLSIAQRRALEEQYADYWGQRWFMLPNPVYGSWLSALYDYQWGLPESRKRAIRWQLLETFEP